MSELTFLAVHTTEASSRFRPLKRSSMERRLREAGAQFSERDGWLVATRVPGEEDHVPKVRDVTHEFAVYEGETDEDVSGPLAVRLPAGKAFVAGDGAAEPLLDLTAAYAALEIVGNGASTVMRRMTDLDLDDLPAVGALAHLRAWVFRPEAERYLVFFPQEYGHYLWEVAVDAAEPLGGGPAA